MPLSVLFRDSALAVVDKPAGLAVDEDVLPLLARELAPPGGRAWPRIVHRLDRGTSGCLLFALRKAAEEALGRAFDEGAVEKTYVAIVQGSPPEALELDTPYGQDPADRRRFTTRLQTARRARLRFEKVEQLRGAAFLRIHLDTGRTHQIRVQLSESGFPVLGDETYGVPGEMGSACDGRSANARSIPADRLMLHAERLAFPHPETGTKVVCESPLPDALRAALVQLR